MDVLPLSWSVAIAAVALILGIRAARRLPDECDSMDGRTVGRHAPYVYLLLPMSVLALAGDVVLTRYPDVQWHLPPWALIYYAPVSRGAVAAVLTFIGTLVSVLALRARRPRAWMVAAATVGLVAAFVIAQSLIAPPIDASRLDRHEKDGVVLQTSGATCVAATCANIVRTFGLLTYEADMVRLLGTTESGTSTAQLLYGMSHLGLRCRLVDARSINEVRPPAVLFVSGADGHAIAYVGAYEGRLMLLDPMRGRVFLTPEELSRIWQGHAVEIADARSI